MLWDFRISRALAHSVVDILFKVEHMYIVVTGITHNHSRNLSCISISVSHSSILGLFSFVYHVRRLHDMYPITLPQ